MPTVKAYKDGMCVQTVQGALYDEIAAMIKKHAWRDGDSSTSTKYTPTNASTNTPREELWTSYSSLHLGTASHMCSLLAQTRPLRLVDLALPLSGIRESFFVYNDRIYRIYIRCGGSTKNAYQDLPVHGVHVLVLWDIVGISLMVIRIARSTLGIPVGISYIEFGNVAVDNWA
eukprot:8678280-Pyramimonas_sp.AAC.2